MDDIPNAEQLFQRIRVLFGIAPVESTPWPDDSPYSSAEGIETFQITDMPALDAEPGDPSEAAAMWLNTPNPTFGGLCPKIYLEGNPDQRAFLHSILSSREDGAFS